MQETFSPKQIIESLIFAAKEPVNYDDIVRVIDNIDAEGIRQIINELNDEYAQHNRTFRIQFSSGIYRFVTLPEYAKFIRRMMNASARIYLSRAALETLSIIAYKQPITRSDIEAVRGVDVAGILRQLIDRRLISIIKPKRGMGRSMRYVTTNDFLRHFGLNSLDELPKPEELAELSQVQAAISAEEKSNETSTLELTYKTNTQELINGN